jgi:hypothetical protein
MIMSDGNLADKLVLRDFWPACANCTHYQECRGGAPRHPAFPHTWHWGREVAAFPDGDLILVSWVGTIAIGQPHTGCQDYQVDSQHMLPLQDRHRQYLALEEERRRLEAELNQFEQQGLYNEHVEALYEQYEGILEAQDQLRAQ